MSMNILVETRVAPGAIFARENPILGPGEIAINKEGDEARIGDGITHWDKLTNKVTAREVVQKWLIIAQSSTNSHLVTLPDVNFAYSVVSADSNSEIENTIENLVKNKNYLSVTEKINPEIDNTSEDIGTLTLAGSELFDILFLTESSQDAIESIEKLRIVGEDELNAKVFTFVDNSARNIANNAQQSIAEFSTELNQIEINLNNSTNLFTKTGVTKGVVPSPQSNKKDDKFVLTANGNWNQLDAEKIKLSSTNSTPLSQKIEELSNRTHFRLGTTDSAPLKEDETQATQEHYVLTCLGKNDTGLRYNHNVKIVNNVLLGAAYNDYAEARQTAGVQAGRVVVENGDDTLSISSDRLMLGGNIVSDTYGMLIGETNEAKTPIALCGRVLAYPLENRDEYYPGAPVGTGPNGTVSLMSKDEVLHYPECIIGYVSAIPNYEEWNGKKVDGRIWIKVV